MTMFKVGEKYETRRGSEWKVVWIGERYLIVIDEQEFPGQRYLDGRIDPDSNSGGDLIPRTKEVTRWTNIYEFKDGYQHSGFFESEAQANTHAHADRLACSPITFTIPDDGGSERQ